MSDYNNIASNHCAATCVANMALNFAARGFTNLKINNSMYSTFVAVHNIIGNGPVFSISSGATTYFSNRGYTLHYASVSSFNDIVSAINSNRPCPTLLADYFGEWHWVLGVGYKRYTSSGADYLRIVNGWENTSQYYYKLNSGSAWISTTQYWI